MRLSNSDRLAQLLAVPSDDCIVWTGGLTDKGYGRYNLDGVQTRAHRVAHLQATGEWPKVVRHTCDNPPCINPRHLQTGTQDDNMKDMAKRKRSRRYIDLTPEQVLAIGTAEGTQVEIAKRFGITQPRVSKIRIAYRRQADVYGSHSLADHAGQEEVLPATADAQREVR